MKLSAHPMVVAAALGLLGPAALADDAPADAIAGTWTRVRGGHAPADLGAAIEVIPFEDRLLVGSLDGGGHGGTWTRLDDGRGQSELRLGSTRVLREMARDGERLQVRTTVLDGEAPRCFLDVYARRA